MVHRTTLHTSHRWLFAFAAAALAACSSSESAEPVPGTGAGAATGTGTPSGADDPASLPLLEPDDLTLLGAFRLPGGNFGDPEVADSFGYGGTALAYHATNDSLFVVGHDWNQWVGEVSVPALSPSTSFDELTEASVLQGMADITEGHMADLGVDGAPLDGPKVGGLLVDGEWLVGAAYLYYDAAIEADRSHFVSGLTLSTSDDFQGMFRVGDQNPGLTAGPMAPIPLPWRVLLGGSALTGNCCLSIISRSSQGPAVSVFEPSELGTAQTIPATWVLGYPMDHPTLGSWDNQETVNPDYNMGTSMAGVVFPEGTRSVLFIGRTGMGVPCYGLGTDDEEQAGTLDPDGVMYCYDPVSAAKGTHAYPYAAFVWAYDALDLAAVAAGTTQPWEVVPYATFELELPLATEANAVQGTTYDPATKRLFVSHMSTSMGGVPAVTVFSLP